MAIIFYHEGLLMVQRGSPSDFPILRYQGGASNPPPPIPTIDGSEVALRRVNQRIHVAYDSQERLKRKRFLCHVSCVLGASFWRHGLCSGLTGFSLWARFYMLLSLVWVSCGFEICVILCDRGSCWLMYNFLLYIFDMICFLFSVK